MHEYTQFLLLYIFFIYKRVKKRGIMGHSFSNIDNKNGLSLGLVDYTAPVKTNTIKDIKEKQKMLLNFKLPKAEAQKNLKPDKDALFNFDKQKFDFSLKSYVKSDANVPGKESGFTKEIPGWYVLKDNTARQDQLNAHLSKFKTDKEQLKEVQRLVSKGITKTDVTLLAGTLEKLRKNIIVGSAKSIVNINGSEELKTFAGVAVANEIPKINPTKRYGVLQVALNTNNKEVRMAAASNVVSLPKEDQIKGIKSIAATGDQAVINSLAGISYKTNKNIQSIIQSIIQKPNYVETKQILPKMEEKIKSESKFETTKQINEKNKPESKINTEKQTTEKNQAKNTKLSEKELKKITYQKLNLSEKIKRAINSTLGNRDYLIKRIFNKISEREKIFLISSLSSNELSHVFGCILQNGPSMNVLSKAIKSLEKVDNGNKEEFIKKINSSGFLNVMGAQIGLFSSSTQRIFVEESAKKGELNKINENLLSESVKEDYTKLVNKSNQHC